MTMFLRLAFAGAALTLPATVAPAQTLPAIPDAKSTPLLSMRDIPGLSEIQTALKVTSLVEQLTRNQSQPRIVSSASPLLQEAHLSFDFVVPDVTAAIALFNSVQGIEIPGTRIDVVVSCDVRVTAKMDLKNVRVVADPKKANVIAVTLPKIELEAKRPKSGEYGLHVKYGNLTNPSLGGSRVEAAIENLLGDLAKNGEGAEKALAQKKAYKRLIEEELEGLLAKKFPNQIFLIKFDE